MSVVTMFDLRQKKKMSRDSLNMRILALYIANGKLIAKFRSANELKLKHNVFDSLKENSLRICAPMPDGELPLITHCRWSVHDLSSGGIHTKDVLWRFGDVVSPQCTPKRMKLRSPAGRLAKTVVQLRARVKLHPLATAIRQALDCGLLWPSYSL